jgi:hypothetical protein
MNLDDIYRKLQLEATDRVKKVRDKIPMRGSKWLQSLKPYVNLPEDQRCGELLRSTLLSDGTISCPRITYLESLTLKAKDIENGVVLTDNEFVHNSEKFHFYVEVDWIHPKVLPNDEQIESYIRLMQNTLRDCFPTNVEDYSLYVLQNSAYLKEKDSTIYLAMGLHIICPGIFTRTQDNFRVAGLIDIRVLDVEPLWVGKTDLTSYHDATANLRPAYAYKMVKCPTCHLERSLQSKQVDNNEDDDDNNNITEINPESIDAPRPRKKRARKNSTKNTKSSKRHTPNPDSFLSASTLFCTECFKGKVISPNFYDMRYILDNNANLHKIEKNQYSVLEVLTKTTLVLTELAECHVMEKQPDMGSIADLQPGKIAPAAFMKLKGTKIQESQCDGILKFFSDIIRRMISQFNPEYAHVIPSEPLQRKNKKGKHADIIIPVKGHGAHYCLRTKSVHANNVYYKLTHNGILQFQCHKQACKEFLDPKIASKSTLQVIQIKLTNEEKATCRRVLGFGYQTLSNDGQREWKPEIAMKQDIVPDPKDVLTLVKTLEEEEDVLEEW